MFGTQRRTIRASLPNLCSTIEILLYHDFSELKIVHGQICTNLQDDGNFQALLLNPGLGMPGSGATPAILSTNHSQLEW